MRISDWCSDVCSSVLLEARGEGFRAFGDRVLDDLRGRQRVRAGGERHREARAGMPVDAAQHIIALRAQLDLRDIGEPYRGAARLRLEDDVAELLGRLEP